MFVRNRCPRVRRRAQAILVLTALAACGGDGPTELPGPAVDGSVAGIVARQKTGVGVSDVVVIAATPSGTVVGATFTAGDGSFAFDGLADGTYELSLAHLERAGVDPRFEAIEPATTSVRVGSDPAGEVVFAVVGLVPARIAGDVTCGGTPVPGVSVRVVGGATDASVTTSPQGRYAALELAPGKYTVIAGELPCSLNDRVKVAEVLLGQFVEVDFAGGAG